LVYLLIYWKVQVLITVGGQEEAEVGWRPEDGRADAAPVWASTDGGLCMQQPLQAAAVSGEPRMGAGEATA
jgi:hypothetical protein